MESLEGITLPLNKKNDLVTLTVAGHHSIILTVGLRTLLGFEGMAVDEGATDSRAMKIIFIVVLMIVSIILEPTQKTLQLIKCYMCTEMKLIQVKILLMVRDLICKLVLGYLVILVGMSIP